MDIEATAKQLQTQMDCARNAGIYDHLFLAFGALLGHCREGGMIGHDDDLDLGINSDRSRSVLKETIKREGITWPNIFGGPTGENQIARDWNVYGWPTVYVLDQQGIIRYKNIGGEGIEASVKELLEKTE